MTGGARDPLGSQTLLPEVKWEMTATLSALKVPAEAKQKKKPPGTPDEGFATFCDAARNVTHDFLSR